MEEPGRPGWARNPGDFSPAGEAHEWIQDLGTVEQLAIFSRSQIPVLEGTIAIRDEEFVTSGHGEDAGRREAAVGARDLQIDAARSLSPPRIEEKGIVADHDEVIAIGSEEGDAAPGAGRKLEALDASEEGEAPFGSLEDVRLEERGAAGPDEQGREPAIPATVDDDVLFRDVDG